MDRLFKDKSEESLKVAEYCEQNKYYANSISRYYYSILQLIHYILKKNNYILQEDKLKTDSTHIYLCTSFSKFAQSKISGFNFLKFGNTFDSLKKYRTIADYKKEKIEPIDLEKFKLLYNFILGEINRHENETN